MDHRYIDENAVAERYLKRVLLPHERAAFEEHLVDCQECTDRVLLAEVFQVRNGSPERALAVPSFASAPAELPLRARIAARFSPWQLLLIFILAALLLLAAPTAGFLWELGRLRG